MLKMTERGLSRASLALLSSFYAPLRIMLPILCERLTSKKALNVWFYCLGQGRLAEIGRKTCLFSNIDLKKSLFYWNNIFIAITSVLHASSGPCWAGDSCPRRTFATWRGGRCNGICFCNELSRTSGRSRARVAKNAYFLLTIWYHVLLWYF